MYRYIRSEIPSTPRSAFCAISALWIGNNMDHNLKDGIVTYIRPRGENRANMVLTCAEHNKHSSTLLRHRYKGLTLPCLGTCFFPTEKKKKEKNSKHSIDMPLTKRIGTLVPVPSDHRPSVCQKASPSPQSCLPIGKSRPPRLVRPPREPMVQYRSTPFWTTQRSKCSKTVVADASICENYLC